MFTFFGGFLGKYFFTFWLMCALTAEQKFYLLEDICIMLYTCQIVTQTVTSKPLLFTLYDHIAEVKLATLKVKPCSGTSGSK